MNHNKYSILYIYRNMITQTPLYPDLKVSYREGSKESHEDTEGCKKDGKKAAKSEWR